MLKRGSEAYTRRVKGVSMPENPFPLLCASTLKVCARFREISPRPAHFQTVSLSRRGESAALVGRPWKARRWSPATALVAVHLPQAGCSQRRVTRRPVRLLRSPRGGRGILGRCRSRAWLLLTRGQPCIRARTRTTRSSSRSGWRERSELQITWPAPERPFLRPRSASRDHAPGPAIPRKRTLMIWA